MFYSKIYSEELVVENIKISNKDQIIMSLVHYFVTKESYTPIVVKGAKDEVWLENLSAPIKIIRINGNYIHNDEQYNIDVLKLKFVLKQIKKRTFTFKMNALNICLDVADRVNMHSQSKVHTVSFKDINDIEKNTFFKDNFPNIKTDLIKKSDNLDLIKNVTDDINETTNKKNKMFEEIFKSKKIVVTYVLMFICTFLFILTILTNYNLLNFGANNGFNVKNGEYYRLFTSIFLHVNFIHLFVNMYSLNILGKQLENFIGKFKFLIIFILSGLSGSLISILINGDLNFSVGASGAIFGLAASLVYFGYYYRAYLNSVMINQLFPIILLNLVLGFMISGIDNAAHIGGLIGGYLTSVAVGVTGKSKKSEQINGIVALVIYFIFLLYLMFFY